MATKKVEKKVEKTVDKAAALAVNGGPKETAWTTP